MTPKLYTIPEAAEALRISKNSLLRLVKKGEVGVVRYPGEGTRASRVVIREEDIEAFLTRHYTVPKSGEGNEGISSKVSGNGDGEDGGE